MKVLFTSFDTKLFVLIIVFGLQVVFSSNEVNVSFFEASDSSKTFVNDDEIPAMKIPGILLGTEDLERPIEGLIQSDDKVYATCDYNFSFDNADEDTPTNEWIAFIPLLDDITIETTYDNQQCSILEMVKAAMLLGASAAVLITVEPKWMFKLNDWNKLKFPVVIVDKNIPASKLIIKRYKHGEKIWVTIEKNKIMEEKHVLNFGTIVEGSKCMKMGGVDANSRGWRSIVCKGGNYTINKVSSNSILSLALSIIGGIILLHIIKGKSQSMENRIAFEDVEEALGRLARTAIMRMPTRKYKRKRHHQEKNAECAVCLENFVPNQLVRVLPCYHSFHCKCVDAWLLKRRTCPLCKLDIIEYHNRRIENQTL